MSPVIYLSPIPWRRISWWRYNTTYYLP